MDILTSIREKISGYKTYIVAVIAIVTAVLAWATGDLSLTELVVAAFAAVQTMFIRAGVAKVAEQTVDIADVRLEGYDDEMDERKHDPSPH